MLGVFRNIDTVLISPLGNCSILEGFGFKFPKNFWKKTDKKQAADLNELYKILMQTRENIANGVISLTGVEGVVDAEAGFIPFDKKE